MAPTLQVGDYLLVRHYHFIEPRRGDVAVFLYRDLNIYYIKRLIGLPGDTIQMRDGTLYINDASVKRERTGTNVDPLLGSPRDVYRETLPNGVAYSILLDSLHAPAAEKACDRANGDSGDAENTCPYVVPPDHYFVMGDNRDNSQDSRIGDFRFVARDHLVGRADLIWWSKTARRQNRRIAPVSAGR